MTRELLKRSRLLWLPVYLAISCVGVAGCGTRSSIPPVPAMLEDSSLFEAVVKALPLSPDILRIDPRYDLRPALDLESRRLPPEIAAQRTRVLDRLGVRSTDLLADLKCHGTAPPPPGGRYDPSGCPPIEAGAYYSVLIGLPERTAEGVVVTTNEMAVTPHGAGSGGWEYHFQNHARTGWVLIKRVNLFMT